ncbi:MAG TPA: PilZ domain-containing protein [Thermoanaerobaculia bacterium]|nr:PilZ domain-containing protein [Thermoanaerobaculia bacterium]
MDQPQRRFPRIPATLTVLVTRLRDRPQDSFGRTHTMGGGGCGFITAEPLEEGAFIEMMISVRPHAIQATARVAYQHDRDDGLYEVGVEFLELSPGDRKLLDGLLETRLEQEEA